MNSMEKYVTNISDLVYSAMTIGDTIERKAEGGNPEACYQMGMIHLLGIEKPISFRMAIAFFSKKSLSSYSYALRLLGFLNECDGNYSSAFQDYAKAYDPNTVKYEADTDYKKNKAIGVDIDIFPLDGIVNDPAVIEKLYKRECFLETLLRLSNQPIFLRKNPIKCINRIIPRIIGSKNLVKMIEKNAQTYDYETSDYVIRMRWSPNGFTGALPKSVFEKDYGEFEGHTFCIPKGYDQFLTAFFGDYMKIPPEEKRVTHIFECYRINDEKN